MSKMHHKLLYIVIGVEVAVIAGLLIWATATKPGTSKTPAVTTTQPSVVLQTPKIVLAIFTGGLTSPTAMTASTDPADKRLFVTEQAGKIQTVDQQGKLGAQPFLDISSKVTNGGEMGLLGLAFHPKYTANGYFYVNYIDKDKNSIIARYTRSAQTKLGDPASEKVLLKLKQPYDNHNGGELQFGRDGYLYAGLGDGGSGGDPQNRAQDKNVLFGKILRLDVDHGNPYGIPTGNPYANLAGSKPEIWALGLRNPWRFSFDTATGDLYIADVGQGTIEEIDVQAAASKGGENYGWRCYEGTQAFNAAGCQDAKAYTAPVIQYDHTEKRCSVTGGYVYRGTTEKALSGKYFYGDYCGGQLYYAEHKNNAWVTTLAASTSYSMSTFGQDQDGNLYVTDYAKGDIYRITDSAN